MHRNRNFSAALAVPAFLGSAWLGGQARGVI